jgi:hypothetical protein
VPCHLIQHNILIFHDNAEHLLSIFEILSSCRLLIISRININSKSYIDHNLMTIRHQPLLSSNPQLCDYAKLKSEKEQKQKTEDSICMRNFRVLDGLF